MDYTMAQAKRDFTRGFLKQFELQYLPPVMGMGGGWHVALWSGLGMDSWGVLVDARSKQTRSFATADAAIRAVRQIGFEASRLSVSSASVR